MEIVKSGLESYFVTGEIPWALFDENVEVHDHDTPDQGDYRGHAGFARWLEDWGAAWAEYSFELQEFIDAGDSVVAVILVKARGERLAEARE